MILFLLLELTDGQYWLHTSSGIGSNPHWKASSHMFWWGALASNTIFGIPIPSASLSWWSADVDDVSKLTSLLEMDGAGDSDI